MTENDWQFARHLGDEHHRRLNRHAVMLVVLLLVLAASTLVAYQLVRSHESVLARSLLANDADQAAAHIQQSIDQHLHRISQHPWTDETRISRTAMVRSLQREHPAYLWVGVVDERGIALWDSEHGLLAAPVPTDRDWSVAVTEAIAHRRETAADLSSVPASLIGVAFPAAAQASSPARAVLLKLDLERIAAESLDEHDRRNLSMELRDGGKQRLAIGSASAATRFVEERPIHIADRALVLRVTPTAVQLRTANPASWILWGGLAMLAAGLVILWQFLLYRRREMVHAARYLEALESLTELSTAISAKLGSGRQILDQLAQLAIRLMRMARSGVGVLDEGGTRLQIQAFSGDIPANPQDTFTPDATLPATLRCLQTGEIFFEENVATPGRPMNQQVAAQFNAGSLILIPLRIEGRSIGLMALSDSRPRRFTPAERRLASLLGSQAAVILANNNLYERISQSLIEQKRLLEVQEKVYAVNAAVYQAGSFEESLRAVTDRAPEALEVDVCAISLVADDGAQAHVAAASGERASGIQGKRYSLEGTEAQRAMKQRDMVVVEQFHDDGRLNADFRDQLNIGSFIHIPLFRSDGSAMGVLTLIRRQPSRFSQEYLRLCQMFASRAAAALENARLHEQTRRDARTQAILLRELHHRVKNNLAGIVGLLSMKQSELEPASRQWLARVIERIQTMARAHDLFRGGVQRVSLDRLVEQVIPSLSVIKPPGVAVHVEMEDGRIELETARAVSLAMALHELCANAIEHGLAGQGTLTIRARRSENRVAIEVCDDGRGVDVDKTRSRQFAMAEVGGRSAEEQGIGLTLVRELVARELHGTFTLAPRDGGGTVAAIEFAVDQHRQEGSVA